jgi:hypothetical protein
MPLNVDKKLSIIFFQIIISDETANVEVNLPFDFTFYEMTFNRINISTFDASVSFVTQRSDVKTRIDVSRRPELEPEKSSRESVLFGSPSSDTFVVRWNKSYELVLYSSGSMLFKYGDVLDETVETESRLIGIGFSIGTGSGLNYYRIDKSPEHHIQKGLTVRYDPLPSCRTLFSNCLECVNSTMNCQWCGHRCQESFLSCPIGANTCEEFYLANHSTELDSHLHFGPHHLAAIFGLLLLIFGLGCGGVLFYGYLRPETRPGQFLNRLRMTRYRRFWERSSYSDTAALRRDSQVTVHSTMTTL